MVRLAKRRPFAVAIPLACLINTVLVGSASAHVKWFCAYNVAEQPVGLENVLCPDFEFLIGLSILALMAGICWKAHRSVLPCCVPSTGRRTPSAKTSKRFFVRVVHSSS